MRIPPPLDVHAHLSADISGEEVRKLGAFVLAVTRSLDEYEMVSQRKDRRTLWGVGVHPGLARSVKNFDATTFSRLLRTTPFIGEIGLEGSSRVPMAEQVCVFRAMLAQLQDQPRIVSVHSSGAHFQVLRELHRTPVKGVVLHWWTGTPELTEEAVRLGCHFSVPPAMITSRNALEHIPPGRVLFETDHPYGDRKALGGARPGAVALSESGLAKLWGVQPQEARIRSWLTLRALLDDVDARTRLDTTWQAVLERLE